MFCTACGTQNPDVGDYCLNCREPLLAPLPAFGFAAAGTEAPSARCNIRTPAPQVPDPEVERIRIQYPELIGVGGWLAWFCIVVTIISPAIVWSGALSEPAPYSAIDIGLGAFSIVTGISLWKVSPLALKLTKILLIIQFCLGALLVAASSHSSRSDSSGIRMLIGSSFWFLYFKQSKRVKATFGRNI